jgi:hypothetical protein
MKSESQTQSGEEKRPEPKLSQESPPGRSWYSPSGLWHRKTTAPPIAEHPKGEAWHNWSAEEVLAQLGSSAPGLVSNLMRPMAIPLVRDMVASVLVNILIAPCLFCAVEEWKWKRHKPENKPVKESL